MSAIHHFNKGVIGPYQYSSEITTPTTTGVFQRGSTDNPIFTDPTPVSTEIGYSHSEPDSNRRYVYPSRNLTVFYSDAYGTTQHINLTSGSPGSYTDVRHIGNDRGSFANSNAFLVNINNSPVGYTWVKPARIKGFEAHGKYSSRTFSNNGTLDIFYYDAANSTWVLLENNANIFGNADWGSTVRSYNFANGPVSCTGIKIQANSVSQYWAVSWFAPIDANNQIFLGHT